MYLDTGILVKLLTPEPETAWFERALRGHSLATSELALVEIKSALFSKERAKVITRELRLRAEAKFAEMIESEGVQLLNLNGQVLKKATRVIETCHPRVPLRALDALHVAQCDLAQEFPICTTDGRMHAAAREMGIPVFPENLPLKI
jgi:uncharacterized protein